MNRVVSLLPSSTEIIHALGCGERLVGRSHECDYPAGITELPPCTEPKFDPNGASREIDERVKAVLKKPCLSTTSTPACSTNSRRISWSRSPNANCAP